MPAVSQNYRAASKFVSPNRAASRPPAPPVYNPFVSLGKPVQRKNQAIDAQQNHLLQTTVASTGGARSIRVSAGVNGSLGSVEVRQTGPSAGELVNLKVTSHARRMGLGSRLAQTALQAATYNGLNQIRLEAASRNHEVPTHALVQMYAHLGFRLQGQTARGNPLMHRGTAIANPSSAPPVQRKVASAAVQRASVRPGPPLASEILARFHHAPAALQPVQRKTPPMVIQRMEDDDPLARLFDTYQRNLEQKAIPANDRDIFDIQKDSSYGYDHKKISYGGSDVTFKKGFASQPFLIGTGDYDSINSVIALSGVAQYKVAEAILSKIDDQNSAYFDSVSAGKPALQKAMFDLINLTQVIEPHDSRAPGWDKVARSLFASILNGRQSFKTCFNRKNGLFLPAWRKAAGAPCGGQEAVRAFMNLTRKKSDNRNIDDGLIFSLVSDLLEELNEMSDSSGEEDN